MNRILIFAAAAVPLLADASLKGAALLVLAGVGVLVMRRASASARHMVWLAAMVALLIVPVLSVVLPGWRVLPRWSAREAVVADVAMPRAAEKPALTAPPTERPVVFPAAAPLPVPEMAAVLRPSVPVLVASESVMPFPRHGWLLPIWAAGCGVLVLRLTAAHVLLRRSTRRCEPANGALVATLEAARVECGVSQPVRLLMDKGRTIPVVWGMFRPQLLLPAEAEHWNATQLRSVLLHELAHLRRRDPLTQFLTQLACALHWFNPLVWLAAWRLHVERERACDDLVLARGVKPSAYAEHLLQIATQLSPARWTQACGLAMARKSSIEGRLHAVLSDKLNRRSVTRALTAAALMLGAIIAVPLAMLRAADEKWDSPLQTAAEKMTAATIRQGGALPERFGGVAWGETQPTGLRAAWVLEPMAAEHRMGTALKARLLVQNAGTIPVMARVPTWHQGGVSARDEAGGEVEVSGIDWTTIARLVPVCLAPGEYIEINAPGVGLGKDAGRGPWAGPRVGSNVLAKDGAELILTHGPIPLDGSGVGMREDAPHIVGPGWWQAHIKERLSRELPLPSSGAKRTHLLDRAVRDLFATTPTADEIASFATDQSDGALDALVQRLAARVDRVEFSGSLPTAPVKFRVLPADPGIADKAPRVVLGPGEYPLSGGTAARGAVMLKIVGRPVGDRRTNDAQILFEATEATGKLPPNPHKLEIPDGWGTWAIVCRPGEGFFYVLHKGGARKIDYSDPAKVTDLPATVVPVEFRDEVKRQLDLAGVAAESLAEVFERAAAPASETGEARAPEQTHLWNDKYAAVAYQTGEDVNFVLVHEGFISTGIEESFSPMSGWWRIAGNIHLVDSKLTEAAGKNVDKRVIAVKHTSDEPGTLYLDGKAYALGAGRVFVLGDAGEPFQAARSMALRTKEDLVKIGDIVIEDVKRARQGKTPEPKQTGSVQPVTDGKSSAQVLRADGQEPIVILTGRALTASPESTGREGGLTMDVATSDKTITVRYVWPEDAPGFLDLKAGGYPVSRFDLSRGRVFYVHFEKLEFAAEIFQVPAGTKVPAIDSPAALTEAAAAVTAWYASCDDRARWESSRVVVPESEYKGGKPLDAGADKIVWGEANDAGLRLGIGGLEPGVAYAVGQQLPVKQYIRNDSGSVVAFSPTQIFNEGVGGELVRKADGKKFPHQRGYPGQGFFDRVRLAAGHYIEIGSGPMRTIMAEKNGSSPGGMDMMAHGFTVWPGEYTLRLTHDIGQFLGRPANSHFGDPRNAPGLGEWTGVLTSEAVPLRLADEQVKTAKAGDSEAFGSQYMIAFEKGVIRLRHYKGYPNMAQTGGPWEDGIRDWKIPAADGEYVAAWAVGGNGIWVKDASGITHLIVKENLTEIGKWTLEQAAGGRGDMPAGVRAVLQLPPGRVEEKPSAEAPAAGGPVKPRRESAQSLFRRWQAGARTDGMIPAAVAEQLAGEVEPVDDTARALFKRWKVYSRTNGMIPGGLVGRLVESINVYLKRPPREDAVPKLAAVRAKLDKSRDWTPRDAAAMLDEVSAIEDLPVFWARGSLDYLEGGYLSRGKPLPDELRDVGWGKPGSKGLRAAWRLEPRAAVYAPESVLRARVLFHNTGRVPVVFTTNEEHRLDEHHAHDAGGKAIAVEPSRDEGMEIHRMCRLGPGEFCEVTAPRVAIGWRDRRDIDVFINIGAKEGDEVILSHKVEAGWIPPDVDGEWTNPVVEELAARMSEAITERIELESPLPHAAADRESIVRRLMMDFTGEPPTDERVRAFVTDDSSDAMVKLRDHLLANLVSVTWSGPLETGETRFRVVPTDPAAAKAARSANSAGRYVLGDAVDLRISQTASALGRRNRATIVFRSPDPEQVSGYKPYEIALLDGTDTYGMVWVRGAGELWVMENGLVRRYDFREPGAVKEVRIESGSIGDIPEPLREAMKQAFGELAATGQQQRQRASGAGARRAVDWGKFPAYDELEDPFVTEKALELAAKAELASDEVRRLMFMILQATVEKAGELQPLLKDDQLKRKDDEHHSLALALAAYDYSLNGNREALRFMLDELANGPAGDVQAAVPFGFIDEWELTMAAHEKHFARGADGAAGESYGLFWEQRSVLYPEQLARYQEKALKGAGLDAESRRGVWTGSKDGVSVALRFGDDVSWVIRNGEGFATATLKVSPGVPATHLDVMVLHGKEEWVQCGRVSRGAGGGLQLEIWPHTSAAPFLPRISGLELTKRPSEVPGVSREAVLLDSDVEGRLAWGEPVNGVRAALVRVSPGGDTKPGTVIDLNVVAQNVSEQPVTFRGESPVAGAVPKIVLADGTVKDVGQNIVDILSAVNDLVLPPRHVIVMTLMSMAIGEFGADTRSADPNRSVGYSTGKLADGAVVAGLTASLSFGHGPANAWKGTLMSGTLSLEADRPEQKASVLDASTEAQLDWGEPVNGLRGALIIRSPGPGKPEGIYLAVQNVSDAALRFVDEVRDERLRALYLGDAKGVKAVLSNAEPTMTDVTIEPRGVVYLNMMLRDASAEVAAVLIEGIRKDSLERWRGALELRDVPDGAWKGKLTTGETRGAVQEGGRR
jgi:beta-lactamase regulating signal transducer with metallopeptidase domain